jgi:hypothetical protein
MSSLPSISYFFTHWINYNVKMIFIKYDNFMKIKIDDREITLSFKTFMDIPNIFEIYILSLLMSNDVEIISENNSYHLCINKYLYKNCKFILSEETICLGTRNPLNRQAPKRESSRKKIRKFLKYFDKNFIQHNRNPIILINAYIKFATRVANDLVY